MRVEIAGIARKGIGFRFTFDGQAIDAHPGETIAAALIAAGIWRFRAARDGSPRGVFCGMGVCGECQVRIAGESRRACLEPARAGIEVTHSAFDAPVALDDRAPARTDWESLAPDVLVVGAGPAGLAAARAAAEGGLSVHVIDERAKAGGQYFKQPADGFAIDAHRLDSQFREGAALYAAARDAGARFTFGATAWGATAPGTVMVAVEGRSCAITPRRLVLASGAYEYVTPFPGWTLPGVLTTGAAQTLLRAYQVAPGRRVLIAGNGPLNVQVAHELTRAGVRVAALSERAPSPFRSRPAAIARLALTAPALWLSGVAQLRALRAAGVPLRYRHALIAVEGSAQAERAVLAAIAADGSVLPGTETRIDVDAVCVSDGFRPQSELARALGCRFQLDAAGGLIAQRDDCGRTNLPHVFVVGDGGGLGGARIALVQGALAGRAIAQELTGSDDRGGSAPLRRQLQRHRAFQRALWHIFAAPPPTIEPAASTLICRCESVDRASVERALARHGGSLGALKRATRLGMGRCQGRYCAAAAAALIGRQLGVELACEDLFAPRAPFKPVPIAQVAGRFGPEPHAVDLLRTSGRYANTEN